MTPDSTKSAPFESSDIALTIDGVALKVSAIHRHGERPPVVMLHGFGSTKEDYADIVHHRSFDDRPFLAYDAPGCGRSDCTDPSKVSIPFLVQTALAMLDRASFERFHLVGHSMGGLTSLMLAHACPERVLSFANIEGNVAPEDCFLSRQIVDYPHDDPEQFFKAFVERAHRAPAYASALYAASLPYKVRAKAVGGIFRSMVELSDNGALMDKFLSLPCPKMFMYGSQNASLSYLPHIERQGVVLAEIPECGHFPMYSNPVHMWRALDRFQTSAEALRVPRQG
ncbi:alpha/beta fold hydrolase [Pandoraea sputorum]|uniref:alpha/beta fold hydrolase n=1 Tax=Pandoraea sputorum TaxID=93222 RepID=UPI001241D46D|nr:alpha/beta hydrolase [Pandoraea sputorum]VVE78642.1 alpha/beta hydrolase [Pandoraea sputorum]